MFVVDNGAAIAGGFQVFYSRRAAGPYYRWWYEGELQRWRSARVPVNEVPAANLCLSNWKNIPAALKGSVTAHYLD